MVWYIIIYNQFTKIEGNSLLSSYDDVINMTQWYSSDISNKGWAQ